MVRGISSLPRSADCVRLNLPSKVNIMSDHVVPHFHNDAGVPVIEIGSQEFMCVGAKTRRLIIRMCSLGSRQRQRDHLSLLLELLVTDSAPDLGAGEARPPECVLKDKVA